MWRRYECLAVAAVNVVFFLTVKLVCASASSPPQPAAPRSTGRNPDYVGSQACAPCHTAIYNSYQRTSMARASGPAAEDLAPADFTHAPSRVAYKIYQEGTRAWLSFARPGDPEVQGRRELLYYIGSGRRGRSYLFATDGFVFESPVNWYTDKHVWDMAPAYQQTKEIPLNLPAFTSCLHCHVSGMKPPIPGTENRYPTPVFDFNGVVCERCHGPGAAHLRGGPIINPAKLPPARRDAVCMQCHLEGKAAVERPGRHVYEFRPGDDLADYVRYYVLADAPAPGLGAVSQVEALTQSQCKRKTGDAMSCTSCHNPHSSPTPQERTSYYRGKCLACHGERLAVKHHAEQPDCTACHMPASASTDVVHTQVTDHRVPRRPNLAAGLLQDPTVPSKTPRLAPFPDSPAAANDVRDLALAWESLAQGGFPGAASQAERLLRSASTQANDPAVLSALGYVELQAGHTERARDLYRQALALDPSLLDAATNLAVVEARDGHMREAVTLWQDAFARAPGRSSIGMNLARVFCASGQFDQARSYLLRVLEFNPDLAAAKNLLRHVNLGHPTCVE